MLKTSIVDNEIAHFTNTALIYEAPQHFGAVVTICWLVKCFFGKKVSMAMLIIFSCHVAY